MALLTTRLGSEEIQRRALQAAAKVALTMSVASVFGACGGSVATEPARPGADDAGSDGFAADAAPFAEDVATDTTKPVPDAIVDATTCGPITPDAATVTQTECCAAQVAATFSKTQTPPTDEETAWHPELAECCDVVIHAPEGFDALGLTFPQARACCYTLTPPWYSHASAACTPWGPPMPPEMPDAIDETMPLEVRA